MAPGLLRIALISACLVTGGCGILKPEGRCETHRDYPRAGTTPALEVPGDLDPPDTRDALPVPQGRREAVTRDETGRCLERPPRYFGGREPGEEEAVAAGETGPAAASTALEQEIASFIGDWAAAWSRRDAESWFTFYSGDFAPAGYEDHEDWRASQRERFEIEATTEVDPDTIKIETLKEDRLRVTFEQGFGTEPDVRAVIKQLELDAGGLRGWEIVDEEIVDVL